MDSVSKLFHIQGKKVIAVLNNGGVIDVANWREKVNAILMARLPG
jgi:beta-glucosidase